MAEQAPPWPDANTLLARYSELVLGKFDLAVHQTRYTRQHMELVPGVTVIIEKFQRKSGELIQKTIAWDGLTVLGLSGYDGNVAWELREGVARLLTGPEAETLKSTAAFYDGLLPAPAAMTHIGGATLGEVRLGDDTVLAISLRGSTLADAEAGGLPIVYISKSTGLLASVTIGGGKAPWFVGQTFGGYRDFGGLLVATEFTIASRLEAGDFKQSITIEDIRWDGVPEREFELSEAVRALMNRRM